VTREELEQRFRAALVPFSAHRRAVAALLAMDVLDAIPAADLAEALGLIATLYDTGLAPPRDRRALVARIGECPACGSRQVHACPGWGHP
jgi:hypothetical protein